MFIASHFQLLSDLIRCCLFYKLAGCLNWLYRQYELAGQSGRQFNPLLITLPEDIFGIAGRKVS